MQKYDINNTSHWRYNNIVTILDYEFSVSDCLLYLRYGLDDSGCVLVDTAICSGLNEYRFIELIEDNNKIIPSYVDVSSDVLSQANQILSLHSSALENSVLTQEQISNIRTI